MAEVGKQGADVFWDPFGWERPIAGASAQNRFHRIE